MPEFVSNILVFCCHVDRKSNFSKILSLQNDFATLWIASYTYSAEKELEAEFQILLPAWSFIYMRLSHCADTNKSFI